MLCSACRAEAGRLEAYYHNEAQSGMDVCDTHFSHQQTLPTDFPKSEFDKIGEKSNSIFTDPVLKNSNS